ncbi:hypothetical protein B0A49_03051 [Cryomyces minteri]|uniref:Protein RTA1 n=1 Tax=Cryomyces minteri TaxID=331657 RepID=A0A4U0WXF5_9PEZI|nr:hypothetical protein B0A49_03051 [Cryomyces minteri]
MAADHISGGFAFYHYDPSLVAAVLFTILFVLTAFFHVYQLTRTRTWYFIPLTIGAFFEWVGYAFRAVSSVHTPNWTLAPYLVQTLLILVAPALFAASIYLVLGRIILVVDGEKYSTVKTRWLTKIFVTSDVLSLLLQAGGGGIMSGRTAAAMNLGKRLVIIGLIVQILFFGVFLTTALLFDAHTHRHANPGPLTPQIPWRKHMLALYAASALVLLRSLFRVVE